MPKTQYEVRVYQITLRLPVELKARVRKALATINAQPEQMGTVSVNDFVVAAVKRELAVHERGNTE